MTIFVGAMVVDGRTFNGFNTYHREIKDIKDLNRVIKYFEKKISNRKVIDISLNFDGIIEKYLPKDFKKLIFKVESLLSAIEIKNSKEKREEKESKEMSRFLKRLREQQLLMSLAQI